MGNIQDPLKSNTFSSIIGVAVAFLNGHSAPAVRAHVSIAVLNLAV